MNIKGPAKQTQGPGVEVDSMEIPVCFNVPAGALIPQGSCWSIDMTQPTISPASLISPFPGAFAPAWTPTCEVVVPPFNTNAGKLVGVYQGASFNAGTSALSTFANLKIYGMGRVLAAGEGNNAVNVGSNLIISAVQYGAKQGTAALNSQVGIATAYAINTLVTSGAFASGAQTVTVANLEGITTLTALTIDTVASGVQEVVTPSAVVAGVNANTTFTVGGSISAGQTITATINGVAVVYTQVTGDTTTTAATGLKNAINNSVLVQGNATTAPILLPATSAAAVVTVRYITSGTTIPNAITTVAAAGSGFTLTAGASTLGSGTLTTFTATFVNAHAASTQVQGFQNTNAGTLILGNTGNTFSPNLVNCFIQIA